MTEALRRKGMAREAMRSEGMHTANVHAAANVHATIAGMKGTSATNMHTTTTAAKAA